MGTTEPSRPEDVRAAVRDYVLAAHAAYLDHTAHLPPGERGALPLVGACDLTVVAAAARRLHLVATTDPMPPVRGPEVAETDEHAGVRWSVRFLDPSVLPSLGLVADDDPAAVRAVLGIADAVYHLTVDVGGGLTGHHAQHSGVALANQHAGTTRDLERLRRLSDDDPAARELAICVRNGLDVAAGLLVGELTCGRTRPALGTSAAACLELALTDLSGPLATRARP